MTPDPQVSIVVTCYNDGRFLPDALGSLRGSPVPLEIIVVDGGSTDPETLAYLETLQGNPSLTLVRLKKSNLTEARNAGIERARAPYVVPLDADNRLCVANLKRALDIMEKGEKVAVVHGDANVFGLRTYTWTNAPLDPNSLIVSNTIDACVLLNKAAWAEVGGYTSDPGIKCLEDWLLWLELLNRGWKFVYLGATFFDYRLREGSMSRTDGSDLRRVDYSCTYAYPLQKKLVARLVSEKTLSPSQGRLLLGRVELRLAHTHLIYGSFPDGLRTWFRAIGHAPQLVKAHLRILLLCPLKRIALDLFKVDLRYTMISRGKTD